MFAPAATAPAPVTVVPAAAPLDTAALSELDLAQAREQRLRWIAAQDFRMPIQRANKAQLGLEPPQLQIKIVVREGDRDREIELGIGNKLDDKAEYYLTCSESSFLMTWPASSVVPFEIDGKTLFDPGKPVDPKPADEKKDDEKKPGE
jgi:hypothetical protein